MRIVQRWTKEELSVINKHSKKGIDFLLRKLPNRSEQSIRTKCTYLDLDIGNTYNVTERVFKVV